MLLVDQKQPHSAGASFRRDDLLVARGIERDACFVIAAPRQCDPMSERVLSADHLFSREIIWLIGWSKRQGADA